MIVRIRGPKGTERLQLEESCSVQVLVDKAFEKYTSEDKNISRRLCFDPSGKDVIDTRPDGCLKDLKISHGDMLYIVEIEVEDSGQSEDQQAQTPPPGKQEGEEAASKSSTGLSEVAPLAADHPASSLARSMGEGTSNVPTAASHSGLTFGPKAQAEDVIPADVLKALQGSDEGVPADLLDQLQGAGPSATSDEIPSDLLEQFKEEDRQAASEADPVRPADDRFTDRLIGSPEGHDMEDIWGDAVDPLSLMHHALGLNTGRMRTEFSDLNLGAHQQIPTFPRSSMRVGQDSHQPMQLDEDEALAHALAMSMQEGADGEAVDLRHPSSQDTKSQHDSPERGTSERYDFLSEDPDLARALKMSSERSSAATSQAPRRSNARKIPLAHEPFDDANPERTPSLAEDAELARVMQMSMDEIVAENEEGVSRPPARKPKRAPPRAPSDSNRHARPHVRRDSDALRRAEKQKSCIAKIDETDVPTSDYGVELQKAERLSVSELRQRLRALGVSPLMMIEKSEMEESLAKAQVKVGQKYESLVLEVAQMPVSQIKTELRERGYTTKDVFEKVALVERLAKARLKSRPRSSRMTTPSNFANSSTRTAENHVQSSHARAYRKGDQRRSSSKSSSSSHHKHKKPTPSDSYQPRSRPTQSGSHRNRHENMAMRSKDRAKELLDGKYNEVLDRQDRTLEKMYDRNLQRSEYLGLNVPEPSVRPSRSSNRPLYSPPEPSSIRENHRYRRSSLEEDINDILNRNGSSLAARRRSTDEPNLSTSMGYETPPDVYNAESMHQTEGRGQPGSNTSTPPYEASDTVVNMNASLDENDAALQAVLLASLQARVSNEHLENDEDEQLKQALALSAAEQNNKG